MTLTDLFSRRSRHNQLAFPNLSPEGEAVDDTVERRQKISLRRLYGMLPDEAQARLRTSGCGADNLRMTAA